MIWLNRLSAIWLVSVSVGLLLPACSQQELLASRSPQKLELSETGFLASSNELDKPIQNVSFADPQVGWGLSNGNIVRTEDGGRNWAIQLPASESPTPFKHLTVKNEFTKIVAVTPRICLAVGADSVYRTVDAGLSWQVVRLNNVVIRDLRLVDLNRGWLLGEKRESGQTNWVSTVYSTDDGGMTWKDEDSKHAQLSNLTTVWGLWAGVKGDIWIAGDHVVRSIDAGRTWKEITVCEGLFGVPSEVSFYDDENGFLRTNQGNRYCVTADGGESWQSRNLPQARGRTDGIIQTGLITFFSFGTYGVFCSHDDGVTWNKVTEGTYSTGQYLQGYNLLIVAGDRITTIQLPPLTRNP